MFCVKAAAAPNRACGNGRLEEVASAAALLRRLSVTKCVGLQEPGLMTGLLALALWVLA